MGFMENLPRIPPRESRAHSINPFKLMAALTPLQWGFFLSGFFAWVIDAIDFFAVSLSTTRLAPYFGRPVGDVTLAITLTLLFRPVGALVFGLLSDRYGRKWPLVLNVLMLAVISLGSGFVTTFQQFLGVRAAFGCLMGGPWGIAVSLALENMPIECRGLFSGFIQLGYPVGYLIIAALNTNPTVGAPMGWRYLFWAGAAFSAFSGVTRAVLPESTYFKLKKEQERATRESEGLRTNPTRETVVFMKDLGRSMKQCWARCIFGIVFMSAFNFYAHGSQDLYPTYIQKDKGLSIQQSNYATIIGNCGAIVGCSIGGWASQFLGRRITMIVFCVFCCAMLPLWLLPNNFAGLAVGAFFVQAGVQGAYGVVPVYLSEISPPQFRAMWPGVAYQLGNMVASASAQIEAVAGERLVDPRTGLPAYGKVSCILIGVAAFVIILCCLFGTEAQGIQFQDAPVEHPDRTAKLAHDEHVDDEAKPGANEHFEYGARHERQ